jgi:Tfp pilus assembly PilM family ATPase
MRFTRKGLPELLSTPVPSVALEISADRIAAVMLTWSRQRPVVTGFASEALPVGAVRPTLNELNLSNFSAVVETVVKVFKRLPKRPRRVALLIPDSAAKVSFVRFENVPLREADLYQLIQWQMQKATPFRLEDAQLSYTRGRRTSDGGREFVAALIRRDVVEEYQAVCSSAGAHAGIVDLASLNLINATLSIVPPISGDWLLIHVAAGHSTIAIVRGRDLIFFRNRQTDGETQLAELIHQTAMYHEDRLEGKVFTRAFLVGHTANEGSNGSAKKLAETLDDCLKIRIEPLNSTVLSVGEAGSEPTQLNGLAAPIGLLLRSRLRDQ